MKVCVYGAGAIGGHIAARLVEGGADVSLIARGDQLAAIKKNGLRVETLDKIFESRPVATDNPTSLGHQDFVIVTVKAPALPSIVAGLKSLLGSNTRVVFALNGIPWWYSGSVADSVARGDIESEERTLHDEVGVERVIGAVAYTACTVLAPGIVKAENPRNRLILGRPDGADDPRVERLAQLLMDGGLEVDVTDRIRDAVWTKLVSNLIGGSLAVLTGSAMKDAMSSPAISAAAVQMSREVKAVAHAAGCDAGDVDEALRKLSLSTHKQSILQDLELGRAMEIATVFKAPLQIARSFGVPTPMLDLVVDLAVQRAKAAGLFSGSSTGSKEGAV